MKIRNTEFARSNGRGRWISPSASGSIIRKRSCSHYLQKGMTALDLGCGPGFFTMEMARLVGKTGKVIAADLQEGMLDIVRGKIKDTAMADIVKPSFMPTRCDRLDGQVRFYPGFLYAPRSARAMRFFKGNQGAFKSGWQGFDRRTEMACFAGRVSRLDQHNETSRLCGFGRTQRSVSAGRSLLKIRKGDDGHG